MSDFLRENNKMTPKRCLTHGILFMSMELPREFYLLSENTHHAQNIFSEQTTTHKKTMQINPLC